ARIALELAPKVAHLFGPGTRPQLAALIFLALQVARPLPAPPLPPEEAGYRFWQAIKAHREGKLAEALKSLAEARKRHDQRRFVLPKKQQNPLSDPREEIFLRMCDEVKASWTLQGKLGNPDYLTLKDDERDKRVDAIVAKAKTAAEKAAQEAQLKAVGDKLFKGKKVGKVEDLVKLADEERKTATKAIDDLKGTVKKRDVTITGLQKTVKDTQADLTKTKKDLASSEAREKVLKAANDSSLAALKEVAGELKDAEGKAKVK